MLDMWNSQCRNGVWGVWKWKFEHFALKCNGNLWRCIAKLDCEILPKRSGSEQFWELEWVYLIVLHVCNGIWDRCTELNIISKATWTPLIVISTHDKQLYMYIPRCLVCYNVRGLDTASQTQQPRSVWKLFGPIICVTNSPAVKQRFSPWPKIPGYSFFLCWICIYRTYIKISRWVWSSHLWAI